MMGVRSALQTQKQSPAPDNAAAALQTQKQSLAPGNAAGKLEFAQVDSCFKS